MMKNLTNDSCKYWYRYDNDTSKPSPLGFCFKTDGTYIFYKNPKWDRSKRHILLSNEYSKPFWKIINDSLISWDGKIYEIVSLNNDSFIISKNKEIVLRLKRDPDQFTIPDSPSYIILN